MLNRYVYIFFKTIRYIYKYIETVTFFVPTPPLKPNPNPRQYKYKWRRGRCSIFQRKWVQNVSAQLILCGKPVWHTPSLVFSNQSIKLAPLCSSDSVGRTVRLYGSDIWTKCLPFRSERMCAIMILSQTERAFSILLCRILSFIIICGSIHLRDLQIPTVSNADGENWSYEKEQ